MQKRTVLVTLVAVAGLVATAGCSGAQADDAAAKTDVARSATPVTSVTRNRVLATGAVLDLRSVNRISSASNHAGDPVSATFASAALTSRGDTVIPVGAVLSGSITTIAPSGKPSSPGALVLAFNTLTIGSRNYPVHVDVTSLATHLDAAGVTTDDAAKVAVGAAVGGVAGRVIGHNTTGTLIGAGAGAAAGAVYAHATRNRDIVLLDGAAIGAVLSDPFTRSFTTRN